MVSIDAGHSNLQLHDQEQIRREVVKLVSHLKAETLAGENVVQAQLRAYPGNMALDEKSSKRVAVLMAESLVVPVNL